MLSEGNKAKQNEKVDVIGGIEDEKEDRKHKGLSMFAELGSHE